MPTDENIKGQLSLVNWQEVGGKLERVVKLKNFSEAMLLVNRVAKLAEKLNHHPEILINFNKVTFTLFTHSENDITEKDFEAARKIESLVSN